MKQPELGQKLTNLRKEKNLTQEELVEACNVSVRTIQRIESGDVTPRTSTIKIILAALNEDFASFKSETQRATNVKGNQSTENWLLVAWIAGIVYFVVGFLESGLDYTRFEEGDRGTPVLLYISTKAIALISYSLFMFGMVKLAEVFDNYLLRIASYLAIVITASIITIDVISLLVLTESDHLTLSIIGAESISAGAAAIIFGIGLIRLQDGMGRIALLAGVFEVILGLCFVVVILFFVGLILLIPALILEIVILYKAYEFMIRERNETA